ncbi:MAG TPA: hypothetical protein VEW71_07850 [Allosphingosinicella sp.]|nr:hypothetical protein [Allosphingosinicella sp.]
MIRRAAALLMLMPACSSPAPGPHRDVPLALREVSGLALASAGSVFAHDDERAIVHEIELAGGRTLRRFSLGGPPARGDFEGIAADRGRIYLIRSDGLLLAARIGADRERLPFEVHDTGAGAECEIEGLSPAPEPGNLLILCKRSRRGGQEGRLLIYQWNIGTREPVRRPWRDIDLRDSLGDEREGFAPSSIEWVPARRQLILVSARDLRLMVLDETGRILGSHRLAAARHPQPEGVTVTPAGALVIADEGERGRPGRLTVYPPDYLRQVLSRFAETP